MLLFFTSLTQSIAQVGINTESPDPSAILDIEATDKGLLVPRIALTAINQTSLDGVNTAANGLLVYNTNSTLADGEGFYSFNGTNWEKIVTSNSTTNSWDVTGNEGTDDTINFIGTTDNEDIVFKRQNMEAGRLNGQNTSFGVNSLSDNTTGTGITAIGVNSLLLNTTGSGNTAIGEGSSIFNTTGRSNTVVGSQANTTSNGSFNVAVGTSAGSGANNNSSRNVFLGYGAGLQGAASEISGNVFIGHDAGRNSGVSNKLYISNTDTSNPLVYGDFGLGFLRINGGLQVRDPNGIGYQFPAIDGSNNQILQTDGSGNVGWTDVPNSTDADFYEVGTTNAPDTNTDNIFTLGNVSIGEDTAFAELNVDTTTMPFTTNTTLTSNYTGDTTKSNLYSSLIYNGDGNARGIQNIIAGTGNGFRTGIENQLSNAGNGIIKGTTNFLSSSGTASVEGTYNLINGSNAATIIGTRNEVTNNSNNAQYGTLTLLNNSGNGTQVGTFNEISGTGNGVKYGSSNFINNTGSGTKYGVYSSIEITAGGDQYGVYSRALRNSGNTWAGYFLGNVAIGTNSGNIYTLPNSRGLNNQVIQTDGSGNVSWTDLPDTSDADFFEVGTNNPPDDITDNMFTQGKIAIGKITTNASLDIEDTSTDQQSVAITIDKTVPAGNTTTAIKNNLTATGTGSFMFGVHNNMGGTISRQYGLVNDFEDTPGIKWGVLNRFNEVSNAGSFIGMANFLYGEGDSKRGVNNFISVETTFPAGGSTYGTRNDYAINGPGTHYGSFTNFQGITPSTGTLIGNYSNFDYEGSGTFYGTRTLFQTSATGTGTKYGTYVAIPASAGGIHYGVFVDAQKTNGYAGYFLGNVAIGTTGSVYQLPNLRGTNGQIMQTDGAGNVSWADLPTVPNGWQTNGNSGTNPTSNFIGTIDTQDLAIRTNNRESVRVTTDATLLLNGIDSPTQRAIFKNDDSYAHSSDANLDFGTGGGHMMAASNDGGNETGGIHADGNSVTIWSPADSQRAFRVLDEDRWTDNNGNPFDNAAEIAYIDNTGQFMQASDRNRKQNILPINNALSKIEQLNGYTYAFKISEEERKKGEQLTQTSGLIAQELHNVFPEAVHINEHGEYFVHYAGVTPLLVEGIKTLKDENEQLKEQLMQQEMRLKKIEALFRDRE